ncbi:hypothetical protein KIN20_007724 [Parelaphostrongylus tenuis]|uniref:G-protein coupled receptors family 1 profile domain-containing protein n=1 Tax=Parelaphostrongylus tenuis TaxID=148309 RepID=A0AAD5M3S2_PARTN|nr:hypothetical protein KIN20_007724 [Parelaphostrongylus tenuis]
MSVEATFGLRLLGSLLVLLPVICGLVLYMLLGFTLFSSWNVFRENNFYLIIVQLMWCDLCALLVDLYAAFPMILTGVQYMGSSVILYYVPLAFQGVAFNGIFMFSLLLTTNRFLLFMYPDFHDRLFTTRGTKIICAVVWIYVFLLIALSNIFGCLKEFSAKYFYFWYNCTYANRYRLHYQNLVTIHSSVIPCLMIIMYTIIYVKLKLISRHSNGNTSLSMKQQLKYLVQTALICVLIVAAIAGFISIPYLGLVDYGQLYLNMLLNLILIANNIVTPIVLFSFNNEAALDDELSSTAHDMADELDVSPLTVVNKSH